MTCHHNDAESCVDHIAVGRPEMLQCHGVIRMNASDHNLIYTVRKQPKVDKSFKTIWGRSYRKFEDVLFERDVIFANWDDVIHEPDANVAWNRFSERLISILDKHAPTKTFNL